MDSFALLLDPRVPLDDIRRIAARLTELDCLVPGFIPPGAGLLDVAALKYAERVEGLDTVLLVDRNLASRMAQLAREGAPRRRDTPTEVAIHLMAFAQAMNLDIEPGLAFHELAHRQGDQVATAELAWFRAADRGAATKWIDVALGRAERADLGQAEPPEPHEMAEPPMRWTRNYVAALRTARLALEGGRAAASVTALLDWMIEEFILAGPAFLYAARFLGPRAGAARMFKSLRSADRGKALLGVRNAAWDITYLSEFGRLAALRDATSRQVVFATADRALHELAGTLFCDRRATEDFPSLADVLGRWWPAADARRIADHYFRCVDEVGAGRNRGADLPGDPVGDMIAQGEAFVRGWSARRD